jgi:cellulose synthase/poly-beta-1,6-N-acetylglucosamine synthase-like glycosyltransferase
MWLLEFLFFGMTLLIGWGTFGYILMIWFVALFRARPVPSFPSQWPSISVVIPCYNEEKEIVAKLEDCRKLDYPADCLEVVFADGGSTDHTLQILSDAIRKEEKIRVVPCPRRGKIQQLNHVLPQLKGELIVNTDVDARLSADALKWLAAEFAVSSDVAVVGAYCRPDRPLDIEDYYWAAQNKNRFLESDVHSSSIVIAQCYAFRRALLPAFPEDVVADDIYVAFLATTLGRRVVYSRQVMAVETRTPVSYREFIPHKFRKSNAFLRESLRFLYRLPEMGRFCKIMLITRICQQLLLPWALIFWMLLGGVLATLFRYDIVCLVLATVLILFLFTSRIFAIVKLPDGPHHHSLLTTIKGYFLVTMIMLVTGLSYPFYQQGSDYGRLGSDQG